MDFDRIIARITQKQQELGLTDRALSIASGMSADGLRNWRRRLDDEKSPSMSAKHLTSVAENLGVTPDWLIYGTGGSEAAKTIAIAGTVGAGAQVPVFDAYEKGDGPQVECPPGLSPHGVVAVEVCGDSMEPVYSEGDLLFYSRNSHDGVPAEVVGHRCVCEDEEGMGWVKVIKEGRDPGTFDLHSINSRVDPMYGVKLKWAGRVRLHWPADLVKRKN